MKFNIMGKEWKIKVLSNRKYKQKYGLDSAAITHMEKRVIHLSPHGTDRETIVHELLHAYLVECCTYSSDLDDANLEEVFAELMSKRGYELLSLGDHLYWSISRKKK